MTDPKSFASTYAAPSTDEETLRKRKDLASRLLKAKESGKQMTEAVMSESGVDVGNLQKGSIDTKMGTGLSEEEVAGFAERLYAGKYGGTTPPKSPLSSPASGASSTPNLDAYAQSNFGEGAGGRRSLESESGKALRIARKLQRQGFGQAAEKMALTGAEAKMFEPSIKTEEYRKQQSALAKQGTQQEQETLDYQKRLRDLQNKAIERYNKELDNPNTGVLGTVLGTMFNK